MDRDAQGHTFVQRPRAVVEMDVRRKLLAVIAGLDETDAETGFTQRQQILLRQTPVGIRIALRESLRIVVGFLDIFPDGLIIFI